MTLPVELPILGLPLAGKTTVLEQIALGFAAPIQLRSYTLQLDGPFNGQSLILHTCSVAIHHYRILLWSVPGGCSAEWVLPLLSLHTPALFVIDCQRGLQERQIDWWRVQSAATNLSASLAVLTKADLPGRLSPDQCLPGELRTRPWIHVNATNREGGLTVQTFSREQLPIIAPSLGSGHVLASSKVSSGRGAA